MASKAKGATSVEWPVRERRLRSLRTMRPRERSAALLATETLASMDWSVADFQRMAEALRKA
jgi:hypothetical protein